MEQYCNIRWGINIFKDYDKKVIFSTVKEKENLKIWFKESEEIFSNKFTVVACSHATE